jgi:hypothetical protein
MSVLFWIGASMLAFLQLGSLVVYIAYDRREYTMVYQGFDFNTPGNVRVKEGGPNDRQYRLVAVYTFLIAAVFLLITIIISRP